MEYLLDLDFILYKTYSKSQLDQQVVEELGRKSGYDTAADCWTGDIENFKKLLAAGAPLTINKNGMNVIQLAITYGRGFEVELLIQKGRFKIDERNEHGDTLLHYATTLNSKGCIDKLLNAGAEIDAVNDFGQTPLLKAIENGRAELALALIDANADVNIADHMGCVPFIKAIENPNLSTKDRARILQALLTKNVDVHAALRNGDNALSYLAVSDDNAPLVETLIEKKVAVDPVNGMGNTPLMIASNNNCLKLAHILVLAGADPEFKNNGGFSPLDAASEEMAVQIKKALKERQEIIIKEVAQAVSHASLLPKGGTNKKLRPKLR